MMFSFEMQRKQVTSFPSICKSREASSCMLTQAHKSGTVSTHMLTQVIYAGVDVGSPHEYIRH